MARGLLTGKRQRRRRRQRPLTEAERDRLGAILRQQTARHRALYLRARGRTYRQIAADPLVIRALEHAVSAARVKQLLEQTPSHEDWVEDVEQVQREWCVHLGATDDERDRACWNEVVFPRLLARSRLTQSRWWDEHAPRDQDEAAVALSSGSRRQWRLDVRNHIIGHLFFKRYPDVPPISSSCLAVRQLSSLFALSARQTCRVLREYLLRAERDRVCLPCGRKHRDVLWHAKPESSGVTLEGHQGFICGRQYFGLSDRERMKWRPCRPQEG
jgi:hypothetical protein